MLSSVINNLKAENRASNFIAGNTQSNAASLNSTEIAGPGGVKQIIMVRSFDPELFKGVISRFSEAGSASAIHSLSQEIGVIIGNADDQSSITGRMHSMMDALDIKNPSDSGARNRAVQSVTSFLTEATNVSQKLSQISSKAESRIKDTISSLNSAIAGVFRHNTQITGRGEQIDNASRSAAEDAAVELSKYVRVGHNISSNGRLVVHSRSGSFGGNLVDATHYVQLSYNPSEDSPLSYSIYDASGQVSDQQTIDVVDASGNSLVDCGGELQGLFNFKDSILKDIQGKVEKVVDDAVEGLNIVHNQGVGFPPSTSITGSQTILPTDLLINASGRVEFAPLNPNGTAAATLPIKVDLSQQTDFATLARTITAEGACSASAGAALGRNVDGQGGNSFAIRQAALSLNDIVSGQGSMRLRLQSGSDHNAKVRINAIAIDDAGNAGAVTSTIPTGWTEVKAGDISLTQGIGFNIPAAGNRQQINIAMEIEVVAEDGTHSRETVRYTLDSGAVNGLVDYESPDHAYIQADDPAGPGFAWPGGVAPAGGPPPVLAASFVAAETAGAVVSASISGDRLVLGGMVAILGDGKIDGKEFSHYLGLNDLIVRDASENWVVNPSIAADSKRLALAKAQPQQSDRARDTLTGVTAASATLSLAATAPADGDTVTINGEIFTFRNAPAAANLNEIQVGGNQQASLINLRNRLISGNFPSVSDIVDISIPANGDMTITAKNTGINGNTIAVDSNIAAGLANGLNNAWTNAQRQGDAAALAADRVAATSLYGGVSSGPIDGSGIATASLNFGAGAGLPNAGDTITINGHTITFVGGAPAGPNQIQVPGGGAAAVITALAASLSGQGNFPALTNLMTFTANGTSLDIAARVPGSHGNSIELNLTNGNGGTHRWVNTANAAPGIAGATTLDDGLDAAGSRTAKRFGFDVTAANNLNALAFFNNILFPNGDNKKIQDSFSNDLFEEVKSMVDGYEATMKVADESQKQAFSLYTADRYMDVEIVMQRLMMHHLAKRSIMGVARMLIEGRKLVAGVA